MPSSLIEVVQHDACDSSVPVAALLRKALLIASKLGIPETPEWINNELSGYRGKENVPKYRSMHGRVMGRHLRGWIPAQLPTNDLQQMVSEYVMRDPVAEIEALVNADGDIHVPFSPEPQAVLQELFHHQSEFTLFLSRQTLSAVLDEIRNQVVRWTLELEKAGVHGQGGSFTSEEKQKGQNIIINNSGRLTLGAVGEVSHSNVAAGSNAKAGVSVEDLRKLVAEIAEHLAALTLRPDARREVDAALAELQAMAHTTEHEPGKVRQSLGRILGAVGMMGQSVITAGVTAYIQAWMKQHGM